MPLLEGRSLAVGCEKLVGALIGFGVETAERRPGPSGPCSRIHTLSRRCSSQIGLPKVIKLEAPPMKTPCQNT